ncbi:ROK family protein, partial [Klebsiella michiganensis]
GLATIHSDFPLSLKSVLSRHCPNNYLPEIIRLNYEEYRFAYDAAMANKEKAQYTSTLAL